MVVNINQTWLCIYSKSTKNTTNKTKYNNEKQQNTLISQNQINFQNTSHVL